MASGDWVYEDCCESRRVCLLQPFDFEDLVAQIAGSEILCAEVSSAFDSPGIYFRIEYCLAIGREQFDKFYNGQHGYRGAFYRSPAEGLRANRQVLDGLTNRLLEFDRIESKHVCENTWLPWYKTQART